MINSIECSRKIEKKSSGMTESKETKYHFECEVEQI